MKPTKLQMLELRQEIFRSLLQARAQRHRVGTLGNRRVRFKSIRDDFRVNRHEIVVNKKLLKEDTTELCHAILEELEEFESRDHQRQAHAVVEAQAIVLKWASFLRRNMSRGEFIEFIESKVLTREPDVLTLQAFQHAIQQLEPPEEIECDSPAFAVSTGPVTRKAARGAPTSR